MSEVLILLAFAFFCVFIFLCFFPPSKIQPFVFFVFLVSGGLYIVSSFQDNESENWSSFKAVHNCKVISKRDGGIYTKEQTAYLCDDGIIYWKNE